MTGDILYTYQIFYSVLPEQMCVYTAPLSTYIAAESKPDFLFLNLRTGNADLCMLIIKNMKSKQMDRNNVHWKYFHNG